MKTKLLVIAALLLASVGWATQTPRTWEYKFVKECHENKANSLAGEGWELQQIGMSGSGITTYMTCVFKRPKN